MASSAGPVGGAFAGCQRFPGKVLAPDQKRGFLDPPTCAALVSRIEADRRPSTISDANGDPYNQTSETCDLDPGDPLVDG